MLAICRFFFNKFLFLFFVDGGDSEARNLPREDRNLPREERRMQQSKRKLEDSEHKENGNEDSGVGGTKLVEEEGGAKLEEEEEVVVECEKSARVLREAKGVCSSRWSKANTSERERPENVGLGVRVVAGGDMLEKEDVEEEEGAKRATHYESWSNRASIVREMKVVVSIFFPLNLTELSIYNSTSVCSQTHR